jgi:hypothetical protein
MTSRLKDTNDRIHYPTAWGGHVADRPFPDVVEATTWQSILTAPENREIMLYVTDAAHRLPSFQTRCRWHPDAGFCVCEFREATMWRELSGGES